MPPPRRVLKTISNCPAEVTVIVPKLVVVPSEQQVTSLVAENSEVLPNAAHVAPSVQNVVVAEMMSPLTPGIVCVKATAPPPGCVTSLKPTKVWPSP